MSQADAIRAHLESGRDLTPLEALNTYGCLRLAPRILELRSAGLDIQTIEERRGRKRYARYRLRGPVQRSLFAPSVQTVRHCAAPASDRAGASL